LQASAKRIAAGNIKARRFLWERQYYIFLPLACSYFSCLVWKLSRFPPAEQYISFLEFRLYKMTCKRVCLVKYKTEACVLLCSSLQQ